MTTTSDLLPDYSHIRVGDENSKVLTAGPFYRDGVLIPRTDQRLRFVLKYASYTDDADAIIDWNSVDQAAKIVGEGAASTGIWTIDLRGQDVLPAAGWYWARVDLAALGTPTQWECAGIVTFNIEPV